MIHLQGVSRRFGDVVAVHPLDLEVGAGRTTVLIGPSGCGKSALLRLMIGLEHPDTGTVTIDGTRLDPETAPALRRRMGYVIQDGGLFPHLTARDNVALLARWIGWDPGRISQRMRELADLVHLSAATLDRHPAELSGGQRQRVALMRALALDPNVLLLDEPMGALDPLVRAELQDDLREVFRGLGKTVVLVTHDLGEAALLGDAVVLLRDGRIVQHGPPESLSTAPAEPFVTRFVQAWRRPFA